MTLLIVHLQPIRDLHSKIANAGYRCISLVHRHNGKTKGGEKTLPMFLLEKAAEGYGVQNGLP